MLRIALNGFGRIGKTFVRVLMSDPYVKNHLALVAINVGAADPSQSAYAFIYDSLMGTYHGDVVYKNGFLVIDDYSIAIRAEVDATKLDWNDLAVDWVVDATGFFVQAEKARQHLKAGARSVLITAPARDEDITIIPGINDHLFDADRHRIVSLGSCTTNAVVPMLHIIDQVIPLKRAHITTIHAYTNSQRLLDVDPRSKDPRKSRAAALNIIPTTTGATEVVGRVLPHLKDKITGSALRVPVSLVSLIDCTFLATRDIETSVLHKIFDEAAQGSLKHIIQSTADPLVSSDYQGNSASVIIDKTLTFSQGDSGKIYGWYDNEWGYASRLKDFLVSISQKL